MPGHKAANTKPQTQKESERALACIADDYAARQRSDGVWVSAAAW
jgi:hypothetical protein